MLTHENFIKIAEEIASASKCISKKVGAVIVKDGRILSNGYNGTPKGYINCSEHWNNKDCEEHHDWAQKHEIHAEMNALIWAARNGIAIDGAIIYCTLEPCADCTKNLIAAGIKEIIFKNEYKHTPVEINQFLTDCEVLKIKYIKEI